MLKTLTLSLFLTAVSSAQAPSPETLRVSLHSMSKALAGCRESYTHHDPGTHEAMIRPIIGADNYEKDILSLDHAENLVNGLLVKPEATSGKLLVAILSSSDDFSIGVGSTRTEVLRNVLTENPTAVRASELAIADESLNSCQKSLFNAGDDFVELVMRYVGAEDEALETKRHR